MTTAWRTLCDRRIGLIGLVTVGFATIAQPADARPRQGGGGSVVACSHYGKGCVSGPVRRGPVGLEVRMPGGTWIGCKRNCARTLREEALDFFETLNERVWDQ
jgi:hypothetical protein